MTAALVAAACADEKSGGAPDPQPVDEEEYYAGGRLGTAFNTTSVAYEQPTPAVEADAAMMQRFLNGEALFEKPFMTNATGVRKGLGPLYIRTSCLHCHPGYGHGQRIEGLFDTNTIGNGYLLVIYDENDNYIASLTGMPQTHAVAPFTPPIDESKINVAWRVYETGSFDDGERYELIYPEVTIAADAYYVPLVTTDGRTLSPEEVNIRLESTIGIYGTGLLDAITDEDLEAEYRRQAAEGVSLNPAIWNTAADTWAKTYGATGHPLRFTYALSRGPLQDAAGANAIWNITNVTRSDRRYHYMTKVYAEKASKDPAVQAGFAAHLESYCPDFPLTGDLEQDIYNYLMGTDADGKPIMPAEMSDEDYLDFMVWHRGLAVPAARNLDDEEVQRGKALFTSIGCAYCHRPTWTTGEDRFTDPNGFFAEADSRLPRYPNQKIWPYTDMVQHRLFMKNDIRTGWCRTTPLWGRGLSLKCTNADDRLHDCRARTVVEAILWHGTNEQSDAYESTQRFRKLSKADRDAVVKFIESI